jgi:hypothetical protein
VTPRAFFTQKGYPHALLLTYTFDPYFFEAVVLGWLSGADSLPPLVVMDAGRRDALYGSPSQFLGGLGSRYHLSAFDHAPRAFHPKLWLRLGDQGGLAMLGSGNLTSGGFGRHHELATTWRLGPGHDDTGGWVTPMLAALEDNAHDPVRSRMFERMRGVPWLSEATEPRPPFLSTLGDQRPLTTQLEELVEPGTTYDQVTYFSGSSDRNARMLAWLRDHFGVEHARVVMDPWACSFTRDALAGLDGMEVELFEPVDARPMHAKLMVLTGPHGDLALYGSANCSGAAWCVPPLAYGNVEMMAWHRFEAGKAREELGAFLGWFDEGSTTLRPYGHERLVALEHEEPARSIQPPPGISTLVWDNTSNRLLVTFRRPPARERWALWITPEAHDPIRREFRPSEDDGDGVTWSAGTQAWSPTFGVFATFVRLEWEDRVDGLVHTVWVPLSDQDTLLAPPTVLDDDLRRLMGRLDDNPKADQLLDDFERLGTKLIERIVGIREVPSPARASTSTRSGTSPSAPGAGAAADAQQPARGPTRPARGITTYEGLIKIISDSNLDDVHVDEVTPTRGRERATSRNPNGRAVRVLRQTLLGLEANGGRFIQCARLEDFLAVLGYLAEFIHRYWWDRMKTNAQAAASELSPLAHEFLQFALAVTFDSGRHGAIREFLASPGAAGARAREEFGPTSQLWCDLWIILGDVLGTHHDPFETCLFYRDMYDVACACGHEPRRHAAVDFVYEVENMARHDARPHDCRTVDFGSVEPGDWLWSTTLGWVRFERRNGSKIHVHRYRRRLGKGDRATKLGINYLVWPRHPRYAEFKRLLELKRRDPGAFGQLMGGPISPGGDII